LAVVQEGVIAKRGGPDLKFEVLLERRNDADVVVRQRQLLQLAQCVEALHLGDGVIGQNCTGRPPTHSRSATSGVNAQATNSGHRGFTQGVELAKTAQAFHLRNLVLVEHERCSTCISQTNIRRSTWVLRVVV
jgi:hypothetical protein